MELLRVEHLSRYYGEGPAQVKALDDVSFSVEKGEFVAIMGPSAFRRSAAEGQHWPGPDYQPCPSVGR